MQYFAAPEQAARDVVVTGIGLVTPLGLNRNDSWTRLLQAERAGRSLTPAQIDQFDSLQMLLQRAPGGAVVDHEAVRRRVAAVHEADVVGNFAADELNNLLLLSSDEAWFHAGLAAESIDPDRLGCVIGTSKASLRAMERWSQLSAMEQRSQSETFQNSLLPDAPLRAVAQSLQAQGPVGCPVAACATGLVAVLQAACKIASGDCDVCLAGSGDASLRASVLASFHRLGVTSRYPEPSRACRPFDQSRDGFLIGEGAATFVLESRGHAEQRNAEILATVAAGAWGTDHTGMTQIDANGAAVQRVIGQMARTYSGSVDPDLVSVHGTATETNDLAESRGLASSLNRAVPAFGIKGATGHLLGAAGSVELAFTILALREKRIPGTANLQQLDPQCHLDVVDEVRDVSAREALKLSLGFGGHVAACLIRRDD